MKRWFLFAVGLLLLLTSPVRADKANVAIDGTAYSNRPLYGGNNILRLIDGDTSTVFHGDTAIDTGFAYSVDLGKSFNVSEIRIFPRQDGCCPERLTNFRVSVNKDDGAGNIGAEVWGADQYTNGTNPGSANGSLVTITLPSPQTGRWVQIKTLGDPVPDYSLQMTELQVFADVPPNEVNRAVGTSASSNRPLYGGNSISRLVDGDRSFPIHGLETIDPGLTYEINLGVAVEINRIIIWARQDACCPERLTNYRVSVHKDNNGQIGDQVWSAALHTDGSNPGSDAGSKDTLTKDLDSAGVFKGQWIRIATLDNPVPSYSLQMTEVEVYGTPEAGIKLLLTDQPKVTAAGIDQTASFSLKATVINGDPTLLGYQWQKNGTNIPGATNASYTTAPARTADEGTKYRGIVSYPGQPDLASQEAVLKINYAFGAAAFSNRPLWVQGGWSISKLVNGDRGDVFHGDVSIEAGFAYEVNLGTGIKFDAIDLYPRQDGCCPERFTNMRVSVHSDKNGAIGDSVWSVDLYADGSNPGSGAGTVVHLTKDRDGAGKFEGQWIQILSLDDPVKDYALQMTELEVFGAIASPDPIILISQQPVDEASTPGRVGIFGTEVKVLNGDLSKVGYQWQKNGANIPGANSPSYTTPPLGDADAGAKYRALISYPGLPDVATAEATLSFDYNYAKRTKAFSNRPLWPPGNWNIDQIIDGNRQNFVHGNTGIAPGYAYEIDMGISVDIEQIIIYARQDGCCPERLSNYRVSVHKDDNGKAGQQVWSADLHTDGSNPGELEGKKDVLTKELDPSGQFQGQWIRILALDDPVPDYFLQMSEVEVIGRIKELPPSPKISFQRQGSNLVLSWAAGSLQSADEVGGTWSPVIGATSPHSVQMSVPRRFYRLGQ